MSTIILLKGNLLVHTFKITKPSAEKVRYIRMRMTDTDWNNYIIIFPLIQLKYLEQLFEITKTQYFKSINDLYKFSLCELMTFISFSE